LKTEEEWRQNRFYAQNRPNGDSFSLEQVFMLSFVQRYRPYSSSAPVCALGQLPLGGSDSACGAQFQTPIHLFPANMITTNGRICKENLSVHKLPVNSLQIVHPKS
jgi:hypothetical protein